MRRAAELEAPAMALRRDGGGDARKALDGGRMEGEKRERKRNGEKKKEKKKIKRKMWRRAI